MIQATARYINIKAGIAIKRTLSSGLVFVYDIYIHIALINI